MHALAGVHGRLLIQMHVWRLMKKGRHRLQWRTERALPLLLMLMLLLLLLLLLLLPEVLGVRCDSLVVVGPIPCQQRHRLLRPPVALLCREQNSALLLVHGWAMRLAKWVTLGNRMACERATELNQLGLVAHGLLSEQLFHAFTTCERLHKPSVCVCSLCLLRLHCLKLTCEEPMNDAISARRHGKGRRYAIGRAHRTRPLLLHLTQQNQE